MSASGTTAERIRAPDQGRRRRAPSNRGPFVVSSCREFIGNGFAVSSAFDRTHAERLIDCFQKLFSAWRKPTALTRIYY